MDPLETGALLPGGLFPDPELAFTAKVSQKGGETFEKGTLYPETAEELGALLACKIDCG
jgi:hypothetical protein